MNWRDKKSTRWLGIVWFVLGIVLIADDSPGVGYAFFILGLTFFASSTEKGEEWSSRNPRLARASIVAVTVLGLAITAALIAGKYLGSIAST